MLKIRIMPTLLFKDIGLVKGIGFHSWRRVGSVMQAIKVYNMREVDELIFLDINATNNGKSPDFEYIDELADECFMPMAVGGGIRNIEDVSKLLRVGADKVVIGTASIKNNKIIKRVSDNYGSQCIIVSIDVKINNQKNYEVYIHSGTSATGRDPISLAQEVESLGAGEILLNSIDRDGTMSGYDIEFIKSVSDVISIPVIASGGAGNYEHMALALEEGKASALAAASIFHFTQQTPLGAKLYLHKRGFSVRL